MTKPGVASARAVMRLVDDLEVIAARRGIAAVEGRWQQRFKLAEEGDTLRAEIASRLRRMERGEG